MFGDWSRVREHANYLVLFNQRRSATVRIHADRVVTRAIATQFILGWNDWIDFGRARQRAGRETESDTADGTATVRQRPSPRHGSGYFI